MVKHVSKPPKGSGGIWKELLFYCKGYLPVIIGMVIFAAAGSVCSLIGPNQFSKITDLIEEGMQGGIDLVKVRNIAAFLAILYGLSLLLTYIQGFGMATISSLMAKRLRSDISEKINRLPLRYFDTASYGDVLSRMTNDVDTVSQTLNQSVLSLISNVTLFLSSLLLMFMTNGIMAASGVAASVIGFVFMILMIAKSQKFFLQQQMDIGNMNGHIEEIYTGHTVARVYNAQNQAKADFDVINGRLFESAWKSQFISGMMMPVMGFIGNLGYLVVCIVGAVLALRGDIRFGIIIAFISYIRFFTQPLSQLAQTATSLQSTAAAAGRVFDFLKEEEMEEESNDELIEGVSEEKRILKHIKGDVEFQHVRFSYHTDRIIIKDFCAKVEAGQKIAVVGPTGAGKTTIVNLLMRFYEINEGMILIDGVPTKNLTRANVRDAFCMVLQDTWLFEGTVMENIVFCKTGITEEQVREACKNVGIDHLIRTMPGGYHTILNDKVSLSEGERQLLTIARALIEDAPLLILDEATSSVDTRMEILVQEAMDRLMKGRTAFIIAHRLSTIKNADLILVMKEGDIIECGKHEELLEKNGFYAKLYNSQFEQTIKV